MSDRSATSTPPQVGKKTSRGRRLLEASLGRGRALARELVRGEVIAAPRGQIAPRPPR